jgi:hypothetical protein
VVKKYLDFPLLCWRNSYTLVGKHEEKSYTGDLEADGMIILKRIFKKSGVNVLTSLIRLIVVYSGGLL